LLGKDETMRSKKRICNSDDRYIQKKYSGTKLMNSNAKDANNNSSNAGDGDSQQLLCTMSEEDLNFVYPEVRIYQDGWESSLFTAWIYQILLTEVAGVPTTVGLQTGKETSQASFYSLGNSINYGTATDESGNASIYPYNELGRSNRIANSDCSLTKEPCANALIEVWAPQDEYRPYIVRGTVEPPLGNGMIAQFNFYVPAFTAQEYPSLSIFYGLQGEENRQFLSETFKRPATWKEYCDQVSTTNCSTPDATAERAPEPDSDEESVYFAEGLYMGHFRATEKNNCTLNPTNCTGHIIGVPCNWNTYTDGQLYWNNIVGLESDGPNPPNGGYTYETVYQVWKAALVTKSHIIVSWYEPDIKLEEFARTEAAFQKILLPTPTDVCLAHRTSSDDRCSENITVRRGDNRGACGSPPKDLVKLIATSLKSKNEELDPAEQSPAYEMIRNIKISHLDMNRIFRQYLDINVDRSGNDARQAVCSWIVDNYAKLQWFLPIEYPKTLSKKSQYDAWFVALAQAVGILAGCVALLGMILCWQYRQTKVMVFAQPMFILLILAGLLFVCTGAALIAAEPTREVCLSIMWFIEFGYSIELIPIIVKTSAINRLIQSSKKSRRVNIRRSKLLFDVAMGVVAVTAFLICWTLFDPPDRRETRRLSVDDPALVENDLRCLSDSYFWRAGAFAWEVLLLVMAAVLAVQSRGVLKDFNESNVLGIMVYSHFLFMLIRAILNTLYVGSTFSYAIMATLLSFNYSLDALVAMCIYVLPKLVEARKSPATYQKSRIVARSTARRSLDDREGDALSLLVCTANIGNAEPTQESMEAWIPLRGACESVETLDGDDAPMHGNFDIIAVGMQESTWAEKSTTVELKRASKEEINEDDIVNAMEDHNTATLREMMQDILGEDYSEVAEDQRGQMRLFIWASNEVAEDIADVKVSGANTGIGNVMANKGGIVMTLYYKRTRISFLSAHLAAHEGDVYYQTRCDNIHTILRDSRTFWSSKLDAAISSHHMFVMGDLNFRTKFDGEGKHEEKFQRAKQLIDLKDYEALYGYDELQKGLKDGDLLAGFKTLPCLFPPTFKVQRESGIVYKDQRVPSYTDRILFRSAEGLQGNLFPLAYEPCIDFITSDHKPVRGAFSIIPNDRSSPRLKEVDFRLVFHKMECEDLPAADRNGLSDPYLMFFWDSVALEAEKESFKDKLRKLVQGTSWPRTSVIPKNLNPIWEGETMTLQARNAIVGPEAMLFVVAMDADLISIKDDFLGAIALNVKELISMNHGEREKTLQIERNLEQGGKFAGQIKFQLDIEVTMTKGRLDFGHVDDDDDLRSSFSTRRRSHRSLRFTSKSHGSP
jgi:hypothetical protein